MALVRPAPPGRRQRQADERVAREEEGAAQWSLDALAQAAKAEGLAVKGSQTPPPAAARRRAVAAHAPVGNASRQRRASAIRTAVVTPSTQPPEGATPDLALMSSGQACPAPSPQRQGGLPPVTAAKHCGTSRRGPEKTWVAGARRVRAGQELTRLCRLAQRHDLPRLPCRQCSGPSERRHLHDS